MKMIAAAFAAIALATPLAAQTTTVDIDDDGWRRVDVAAGPGLVIDIDDDGWSVVTAPVASGRMGPATAERGACSQLEAAAGVAGAECGTLDRVEVIQRMLDD
jgi:hypothetical protein